MHFLQVLLFLAPLAAAIQFTYPEAGDTLSRGSTYNVTWTNVDTDPTSFDIYLWNFVYYPPFYHYIKAVQTSDDSTLITIPCDVAAEDGWQFTAVQNMNVYVINAQTGKFTIDNTACNSPTVGPNPESCPSTSTIELNGGGPGVTATVTVGGPSAVPGGGATVTVTVPALSTCSAGKTVTRVSTTTVWKKTAVSTVTMYKTKHAGHTHHVNHRR